MNHLNIGIIPVSSLSLENVSKYTFYTLKGFLIYCKVCLVDEGNYYVCIVEEGPMIRYSLCRLFKPWLRFFSQSKR